MIDVTVERYPGDHPGPDIVDSLIISSAGARARANGEIDASHDAMIISANGPLRDDHIAPGSLIEVVDMERSAWRAQVERSAITLTRNGDNFTATQALEVEKNI